MRPTVRLALFGVALAGTFFLWGRLVDRVIFHPRSGADLAIERIAPNGRNVFLETEDGVRIHGFWLPGGGATRALLLLHGNSGNASHRLPNAAELAALDADVLLLDYRGYGLSSGTPSEPGTYADARAGLRYLVEERGFPEDRIVVFGRSLGGAVAIDLAQDRPLAGLILESTFTSVRDLAQVILPFAAPFVPNRFDSASKIAGLRAPLLVFHGDRDEIVPYEMGRKLFEAAPEPKAFETIRGAGHNDTTVVGGRPYFARIRGFLDQTVPAAPQRGQQH